MISNNGATVSQNTPKAEVLGSLSFHDLFSLGEHTSAESRAYRILECAIQRAVEVVGAERGTLILFGPGEEIVYDTSAGLTDQDAGCMFPAACRDLIRRVKASGTPLFSPEQHDGPLELSDASWWLPGVHCMVGVPLADQDGVFGVIYMDNWPHRNSLQSNSIDILQSVRDNVVLVAKEALSRTLKLRPGILNERELRARHRFEFLIGSAPSFVEVLRLISMVADSDAPVLVQGESGTGKELVARALHVNSRRSDKQFVAINCAGFPDGLLESELFGYSKGSFTGAIRDKAGWFERANGGTFFLDEIGEMPPLLQVKLLRVLQTKEYSPIGSTETRRSDVRLVTATNRDLRDLLERGLFREEVYYRLNVIEINLPPLRERKSDIPILARHFLDSYGAKYSKPDLTLSPEAESALLSYDFPGNIRELENMIQRVVVLVKGRAVELSHLPSYVVPRHHRQSPASNGKALPFSVAKRNIIEKFERDYLVEALKASNGNISKAAYRAGLNVKNFYVKMTNYGIDPHAFKVNDDQRSTSARGPNQRKEPH